MAGLPVVARGPEEKKNLSGWLEEAGSGGRSSLFLPHGVLSVFFAGSGTGFCLEPLEDLLTT